MTPRSWKNIGAWTLAALLSLAGLLWLAEYLDRGVVMRPVRRLADKMGIEIPRPSITPSEEIEAQVMAREWKQECLDKFPELRVTARPVPEAENGFWQLLQLDKQPPVSKDFAKLLEGLKSGYPPDVAARLLAEHSSQVEHIERIADLPGRSSIGLPPTYQGFINARPIKQATEILLLKACLAAKAGNEAEAIHAVRRIHNIITHLRDIENPTLMSEIVAILVHGALQEMVLRDILPKLGPGGDLAIWKELTAGIDYYTPKRYACLVRGEWHLGGGFLVFPAIASEDKLGLLADGKSCALAYSAWMTGVIKECATAQGWDQVHPNEHQNAIAKLPAEQANLMGLLTMGIFSHMDGFERTSLTNARHEAALELLMLEKAGKTLTAESVRDVTHDPLGGDPFIFDPVKRTLGVPAGSGRHHLDELVLPW